VDSSTHLGRFGVGIN